MKLNRNDLRKEILKELRQLNEGGEIPYADRDGKAAAGEALKSAALFFDSERKRPDPGPIRNKFCKEMMALCGHLSTSVRDDRSASGIELDFGKRIVLYGNKIDELLKKYGKYLR